MGHDGHEGHTFLYFTFYTMDKFREKYSEMRKQLSEINRLKNCGYDVSIVVSSFFRLTDEVDDLWTNLTEEERNGFTFMDKV